MQYNMLNSWANTPTGQAYFSNAMLGLPFEI